jgi:hypothetical protein
MKVVGTWQSQNCLLTNWPRIGVAPSNLPKITWSQDHLRLLAACDEWRPGTNLGSTSTLSHSFSSHVVQHRSPSSRPTSRISELDYLTLSHDLFTGDRYHNFKEVYSSPTAGGRTWIPAQQYYNRGVARLGCAYTRDPTALTPGLNANYFAGQLPPLEF